MMQILQENSQSVWFLIFWKTDKEKKNQSRDENKVHVSLNKNERKFNYDNLFVCFDFKKRYNLNRKEYETKNK